MSLERFCRKPLVTVAADALSFEVAEAMLAHHVGAVVVVSEAGRPIGIISDRDLVCRVMAEERDPHFASASSVMTPDPEVAQIDDSIEAAIVTMRNKGIRRLPIVDDDGVLRGLVSLDDLLVLFTAALHQLGAVPRDNQGP